MTPPETPVAGLWAGAAEQSAAVSPLLRVLRRRADFVAASKAARQGMPGVLLQARRRGAGEAVDPRAIRIGFTASRKIGNAVARNRAKRRLRAVARQLLPALGRPGWDYVLVARPGVTVDRPFDALCADVRSALGKVHRR